MIATIFIAFISKYIRFMSLLKFPGSFSEFLQGFRQIPSYLHFISLIFTSFLGQKCMIPPLPENLSKIPWTFKKLQSHPGIRKKRQFFLGFLYNFKERIRHLNSLYFQIIKRPHSKAIILKSYSELVRLFDRGSRLFILKI